MRHRDLPWGVIAASIVVAAALIGTPAVEADSTAVFKPQVPARDKADKVVHVVARVPLPSPVPEVIDAPCPTSPEPACTWPGGPIYVHASGEFAAGFPEISRYMYLHELGHQVDYSLMNDWLRDRFRGLIRDPRPWRSPPNSPHETFADAYAYCALGDGSIRRRVCQFIRRLG